jgi:pimeloyl-ACP methyl ester carboxylesterase
MSSPNVTPAPRAFYLNDGAAPVFAFFHPAADRSRRRAVLLCPPFGWDDMCSYRSRRDWAERLAGGGYSVLRIDLPGSGDSAGSPRDAGRLSAWTLAVTRAADWLRATSGAAQIVTIGIGLGGMLALHALREGAAIDELVLWSASAHGRTLIRELRAFSALEVAYVGDPGAPTPAGSPRRADDGAIVANGYLLSAETVEELARLDLSEPTHERRAPHRALLLGRDGIKVDDRLRVSLEQAGAEVRLADGAGYGAMMIEPQFSRPPVAVFELVDDWLAEGEGSDRSGQALPGPQRDGATAPASAENRLAACGHIDLNCFGADVRETPVHVAGGEGPLFGIFTAPLTAERADVCALLVNAGPQRRTGPSRMWVEIARRWAARGVATLRIDLAGIGDSDGDAATLVHVASLYAQSFARQTRDALDALGELAGAERFVVLGLCAGAYWGAHASLDDERVETLIMLNPRTLIWDAWVYGVGRSRELVRQLAMASTWRKALRGELTLARHLETARALTSRATHAPRFARKGLSTSGRTAAGRGEALLEIFNRLRDRDQHVLMLFTGNEPMHHDLTALNFFERAGSWPNMRVEIRGTSADTHTLTPMWLQRDVHELVDEALEDALNRPPTRRGRSGVNA